MVNATATVATTELFFFFFCCGRLYFYGATERTLTTQEQSCLRLQQRDNTHKHGGRDVRTGMAEELRSGEDE